jgi:hypothetical protein
MNFADFFRQMAIQAVLLRRAARFRHLLFFINRVSPRELVPYDLTTVPSRN